MGNGVFVHGIYGHQEPDVDKLKEEYYYKRFFIDTQLTSFKKLTGEYYQDFLNTLNLQYSNDDIDSFGARVNSFGVRGLFTYMESIIMIRDSDNAIWAAVIVKDEIYYFTNTNTKKIPKTIVKWSQRFREKPFIDKSHK